MTPKYRAWDNGMEMMVYQGDDEIYICFDGEKWKLLDYYRTHWETDEYGMNEIEQPWEVENIEIMQYTGLKDSNGVEIYEGDIVTTKQASLNGSRVHFIEAKGEVKFSDCNFYILQTDNVIDTLENYSVGFENVLTEIITIGNIYENPELLEVEQ